jgi:U3 small nucleolar RNA-associated protein 10
MSSLQKQLAAIAATTSNQLDLKAQRATHGQSLLFPPKVAVSQDFETIYHICLEGFNELCALDRRFNVFASSLFGEESKSQERGRMTLDQIKELDVVIQRFLGLSSSSLLLKPTQKAVEWLVRRFRLAS